MKTQHVVEQVTFHNDMMTLTIDGKGYSFTLADISPRLAVATALERERFEVSPSGYGIHWPLLDEDLSIDGLLGITHQPTFQQKKMAV